MMALKIAANTLLAAYSPLNYNNSTEKISIDYRAKPTFNIKSIYKSILINNKNLRIAKKAKTL